MPEARYFVELLTAWIGCFRIRARRGSRGEGEGWLRARALVGLVAELLEGTVAVAPIFHYFDMEVEEAFFAGELLDIFAGFDAYLFDGFALMAYEDGFLRLPFNEDDCMYVVDTFFLLVAFNGNLTAIGYLLLVEEE